MPRGSKTQIIFSAIGLVLAAALLYQWWAGAPPTAPVTQADATEGGYGALAPAQRRLVDDWVERFGKATGASVPAEDLYDGLALSTRTTFNAVTHALSQTALSDSAGQPMNLTAIDLVARIDAIAGHNPDKGGDKQFRLYVQVRPDAKQVLEKTREFTRQVDNTVFHKGYPICFRGAGSTPSIQFSLSLDGTRGDIDVDYRSSAFPIMLLNGHLTASNSDVRAGNNDERHNGNWRGLRNWWRGFMGLPGVQTPAGALSAVQDTATEPRLGKGTKPEAAITDFLHAWLVERKPGVAVGYVAPRAFACLELERGAPVDRGVARFQMVRTMQAVNDRIGSVRTLSDVVRGVTLTSPRGQEVPHPGRGQFVLYDVREDLAAGLDCESALHPEQADPRRAQSTRFGRYVGAVFQVKTARVTGASVLTLWAQEDGVWRLVTYRAEPELIPGSMPAAPPSLPAAGEPALPVIEGNPDMIMAAADFFDAWFVRKDVPAAFRHLSPASYSCYNVFRSEDSAPAATRAEGGRLILEGMEPVAKWLGAASRLDEVVTAVEAHHPDFRLVTHDASAAFTVVAIPDAMATAVECHRLKPGIAPHGDREGEKQYGNFYAASARLARAGPDGAVLWTVWSRQASGWKIVSYLVITP